LGNCHVYSVTAMCIQLLPCVFSYCHVYSVTAMCIQGQQY
jgi:hypothetical protein